MRYTDKSLGDAIYFFPRVAYAGNHPLVSVDAGAAGVECTLTDGTLSQTRVTGNDKAAHFDLFPFIERLVAESLKYSDITGKSILDSHLSTHISASDLRLSVTIEGETLTGDFIYDNNQVMALVWGSRGYDATDDFDLPCYLGLPWRFDTDVSSYTRANLSITEVGKVDVTRDGVTGIFRVVDTTCGVYLRWLDEQGHTIFWLMDKVESSSEVKRSKLVSVPRHDTLYGEAGSALDTLTIATRTDHMKVGTRAESERQMRHLLSLPASSRVEVYNPGADIQWQQVDVEAVTTTDSGNKYQDFTVELIFPTPQSMTP